MNKSRCPKPCPKKWTVLQVACGKGLGFLCAPYAVQSAVLAKASRSLSAYESAFRRALARGERPDLGAAGSYLAESAEAFLDGHVNAFPFFWRRSAALEASKRDITIFCGHYHMNDVAIVGIVKQFMTPAVSYQIGKTASRTIDKKSFGYRLITINGEDVDTKLVMIQKQPVS